ncbi:MAG: GYD domain-containing protein [Hyphomicrobiaceae bacterium]
MPHFISLMRYTEKGLREIKGSTERARLSAERVEKLGGRSTDFYLTMGAYDLVQVFEMPSEESMMRYLLTARADGYVDPLVLRAFPAADYRRIVESLP